MVVGYTSLSNKGYAIEKKGNIELIDTIIKELTVTPKNNAMMITDIDTSFPVYRENNQKLYLPKYYGISKFGIPYINTLSDGDDCPNLIFNGKIRDTQKPPIEAYIDAVNNPKQMGGILSLPCGFGKCLGKNTPVMMYDGTIKMVQDVQVGDLLMGDDSKPRNVLSTCKGEEHMFTICSEDTRENLYNVNESHILSLKCICNYTTHGMQFIEGQVYDIPVSQYYYLYKNDLNIANGVLYGYHVAVEFYEKEISCDPYIFGYWLGNNNLMKNKYIDEQYSNTNNFKKLLYEHNLIYEKHIPYIYKCNSRENRLQLLAGLIDSNISQQHSKNNIIITVHDKYEKLIDDIISLCRGLGFGSFKQSKYDDKNRLYYTIIKGNTENIPTKLKIIHNKNGTIPLKHTKDHHLLTKIYPVRKEINNYYGFEIDGNRRFLLGDFTVTHNTVCALYLSTHFKKKTLIVCHTNFLIDQWIERIQQYIPTANIGKIKQATCKTEDKDIVIASLQSLSKRDYDKKIFKQFGFVVCDECHHLSAEVFSRCLPKITCKRMLGLSATLKRKDGLSKVFEWYLGKPVYEIKRKDSEVDILIKRYYDPHTAYSKICKLWNDPKKLNYAKMINNICAFTPRNYMIVDTLKDILKKEPNRKVLILSERRNHLQDIEDILKLENFTSIGYYVGGMNKDQLDKGSTADIILATFQLASEAMDIPKLNTLILSSPISSIEQPIGRIQRKKREEREYTPLVVDIFDEFSIFERLGYKRLNFYKKNNYNITDPAKDIRDNLTKQVKYTIIADDDDNDK